MPRHTLDKWTYKLKTMNVCITQHKEEDIYNHMVKMYSKMQELYEKYRSMYDKIINVDLDSDTNMYKKYNWRQGEPSRFWLKNVDQWYSVDVPEDQQEVVQTEYFYFYKIWADFMICDKYSTEWKEEKSDWCDMIYEVNKMHGFIKNTYDTIRLYENMAYNEAKQQWQRIDKDWIEDQNCRKEHKKHNKIELPSITNIEVEPMPYPEVPLRDDCIYCKQHWEETRPRYDEAVKRWLKAKQEDEEYKKQQELEDQKIRQQREQKAKQYQQWLEKQEPIDLHCHECEYEAKDQDDLEKHNECESHKKKMIFCKVCNLQCRSEYDYNNHIVSRKHCSKEEELDKDLEAEKKARYCDICQIQCRNDKEYQYHIETTKHKKNAGLIEKIKIYKCNHCDYQTTVKCNYEKHIVSKNHM